MLKNKKKEEKIDYNKKIKKMLNREKKFFFSLEDPKYKSKLLNKFINRIMNNGKKIKTINMIFFSFKLIKRKFYKNPLNYFKIMVKNLKPSMGIKTYKFAGKPFIIPIPLNVKSSHKLTFGWLKKSINSFYEKYKNNFSTKLTNEIINLLNYYNEINNNSKTEPLTLKYKKELQQKIKENKKNIHFRWKK